MFRFPRTIFLWLFFVCHGLATAHVVRSIVVVGISDGAVCEQLAQQFPSLQTIYLEASTCAGGNQMVKSPGGALQVLPWVPNSPVDLAVSEGWEDANLTCTSFEKGVTMHKNVSAHPVVHFVNPHAVLEEPALAYMDWVESLNIYTKMYSNYNLSSLALQPLVYVILGVQNFHHLPENFIAIQLEQHHDVIFREPLRAIAYISRLQSALQVWEYSLTNVEKLQAKFNLSNVLHMPLGYSEVYRRFENTTVKLPITKFKILFMGTLTTRREKTIKEIHRSGMNVRRIIGYYGPELITMLGRARIVLNIHSQQPGVLEEVRLTFLISLGKVVISEPGDDPRLNAIYAPYVHFAALPKFPKLCSFYLKHPAEWEKRQAQLQGFKNVRDMRQLLNVQRQPFVHLLNTLQLQKLSKLGAKRVALYAFPAGLCYPPDQVPA